MTRIQKQFVAKLAIILWSLFSVQVFAAESAQAQVVNAYKTWCDAVGKAQGNPKAVVKLYAPNSFLLPTFSAKILSNAHGELNSYFATFTKKDNFKCTTDKLMTHIYGDVAVNAGLYTFTYDDAGKIQKVPARFTFVYKQYPQGWLIVSHHSSELPA